MPAERDDGACAEMQMRSLIPREEEGAELTLTN